MILASPYITKKEQGAEWTMIFYHDSVSGGFFSSLQEAMFCENPNRYSIFSKIDKNYKIEGYYEFLLEYPGVSGFNRWKQSELPWSIPEEIGKIATGYIPINISWSGFGFGGLVKSNNNNNGGITLLDGSAGTNYWFYAIGCVNPDVYQPYYPGPSTTVGYSKLWIKNSVQTSTNTRLHVSKHTILFILSMQLVI